MNHQQYKFLNECADTNDATAWNAYRKTQAGERVDLKFASLNNLNLRNFDLSGVDLRFSSLQGSYMSACDVAKAKLSLGHIFFDSIALFLIIWIPAILPATAAFIESHFALITDNEFLIIICNAFIAGLSFFFFYLSFVGLPKNHSAVVAVITTFLCFFIYNSFVNDFQSRENGFQDVATFTFFLTFAVSYLAISILSATKLLSKFIYPLTIFIVALCFIPTPYYMVGVLFGLMSFFALYANTKNDDELAECINLDLAIGYVPKKKRDKNEREKYLEQLEMDLKNIEDEEKIEEINSRIAVLKDELYKQESFRRRIEDTFFDLQKPNAYLQNLLTINWVLLVLFFLVAVGVLLAVGFVEYQVYQKFWLNNQTLKEIPYLAYSPIVLGVVVFSFAIAQFNKRFKEIQSIYDRKRFVLEVESTLRAFGNFYAADTPKIEDYFTQTINKL